MQKLIYIRELSVSKRHVWFHLLLLTTVMGMMACADIPTGPSPENSVVPLQIGNAWSYSYSDTTGQVRQDIRVIDRVKGRYTCQYIDYFRDGDLGWNAGGYYRAWNESDGYHDDDALKFKYPVDAGETYKRQGDTVTVKSVNDTVTVPAGTFRCIRYHTGNTIYWVAPGVGLIRQTWGTLSTKELSDYLVQSAR